MAELKPLTVPCQQVPKDSLILEHTGEHVHLRLHTNFDNAAHVLDKDTAREVFNWLGVYLHQY